MQACIMGKQSKIKLPTGCDGPSVCSRSEEINDLIDDEQAKCLLKIADVARKQVTNY